MFINILDQSYSYRKKVCGTFWKEQLDINKVDNVYIICKVISNK